MQDESASELAPVIPEQFITINVTENGGNQNWPKGALSHVFWASNKSMDGTVALLEPPTRWQYTKQKGNASLFLVYKLY